MDFSAERHSPIRARARQDRKNMSLGKGCSNRRGPKHEGEHETVNKVSLRAQERRAHFSSPSRFQRRAAPGPRRPSFSFLPPLLTRGVSGERTSVPSGTLARARQDRRKVVLGAAVRAKAQGCLFSFHGTRLLEIKSTRFLKNVD